MFDQWGELPLLPFGNPIGFVPASRGGVYIESIKLDPADHLARENQSCLAA